MEGILLLVKLEAVDPSKNIRKTLVKKLKLFKRLNFKLEVTGKTNKISNFSGAILF